MAAPASSMLAGICRPPTPVISLLGQPTFGCECSSFVWNNKGVNVGMCSSVDLDGRPMCYLHQPNNCPDAQESLREPLHHPGGSREAQMAAAVDGLL